MNHQNFRASVSRPRLQDLAIAVIAGGVGLWFLTATIHLYRDRTAFLHYSLVKYAMAAVLLVFAYKTFRYAFKRHVHYVKREHGACVEIGVYPAAPPAAWLPAALPVAMVGGMVLEPDTPGLWVMGLLFTGATAIILLRDPRGLGSTTRRSIRAGPDGIDIGGQMLRQADIHHLLIKNKFAGDVEITYDTNRGVPTGTVIGLAHRRQVAKVAYRVEAECGGKAHILAAGLDEVTARGVLAEVGKALVQKSAA